MPIHDWSRVDVGVFHDFHQGWTVGICNALNAGGLPREYFAMVEESAQWPVQDVIPLRRHATVAEAANASGGINVSDAPPRARIIASAEPSMYAELSIYAARANRIAIRDLDGKIVAMIEVVSPGNKSSATRDSLIRYEKRTSCCRRESTYWSSICFRPHCAIRKASTRQFGTRLATSHSSFHPTSR